MAKVTGPLLSLGASGSIGNAMTFGKWKGIQYARIKATPSNPQSVNQTTQRTLFGAAVTGWQALTENEKGTWTARAAELFENLQFQPSQQKLHQFISRKWPKSNRTLSLKDADFFLSKL